jgi:acetyl esterase/lipase
MPAWGSLNSICPRLPKWRERRYSLTSCDGEKIEARWFEPPNPPKGGSGVVYLHGGGMIAGFRGAV